MEERRTGSSVRKRRGLITACVLVLIAASALVGILENRSGKPDWSPDAPRKSLVGLKENYSRSQAEHDGCVVMDGVKMLSGENLWEEFLERIGQGSPSLIRIYQCYSKQDPETYYVRELVYNGDRYQSSYYEQSKETGEWTFYHETFSYLNEDLTDRNQIKIKGYLLTDRPEETLQGYMAKAASSYYDPEDTSYRSAEPLLIWQIE